MGSQPEEVDQQHRMIKAICLLALVALVKSQELADEIMDQINKYNSRVKCWGQENIDNQILAMIKSQEKCMQMEPSWDVAATLRPSNPFASLVKPLNPFKSLVSGDLTNLQSLWRSKRSAGGLLQADQQDVIDFLMDFKHWGQTFASSIGNVSCVLMDMGVLTEAGEPNIDYYMNLDKAEGFDITKSYANDKVFLESFQNSISDCHKISESWPQASLDRNPISRAFGRNILFFRCARKVEKNLCAMGQMLEWLEKLYGKDPNYDLEAAGLPKNKYYAAAVSVAVLDDAASPEEKAVSDFFWGNF